MSLENQAVRFSEIVNNLWTDPANRKLSTDQPAFKVLVHKRLRRLTNEGDVNKEKKSHKQVFYFLTEQGRAEIGRIYLEELIYSMPPKEVQVLQFLMNFFISHVNVVASPKANLETYIRMLREQLNRADVMDMAEAVMKDPRKLHERFSEYLVRYKAKKVLTLEEHEQVFKKSE
jgi:DNA-binding transcriptional regulator PaaX